jgi:hypothetical protein
MKEVWTVSNEQGSWVVTVGAHIDFVRETRPPHGPVVASGTVDAPIRPSAPGIVTHLKVRGVEGEAGPILVAARHIVGVKARADWTPDPRGG